MGHTEKEESEEGVLEEEESEEDELEEEKGTGEEEELEDSLEKQPLLWLGFRSIFLTESRLPLEMFFQSGFSRKK